MYSYLNSIKWLAEGDTTLDAVAKNLEAFAKWLREMSKDGLQLTQPVDNGYVSICTDNKELAEKYHFELDEDHWDDLEPETPDSDSLEDEEDNGFDAPKDSAK